MAKGSPFTTFTGKLGQIVGFIIKSSASKQVQGMRAYQPNVSNPKTVLQANQRLCLKPLNNFSRALASVIERGFEGVKYGADSRREFMSINMSNFSGPYLRKGSNDAVPGPFVISRGSLVDVAVTGTVSYGDGALKCLISDLYGGTGAIAAGGINTWGALSQALIDNNTDVQAGDQITFVSVLSASGSYVYRVRSLVIDPTSTEGSVVAETAYTYLQVGDVKFVKGLGSTANCIAYALDFNEGEVYAAGAVVQSREGSKGEHLRSTTVMWVAPGVYDVWFSQEQFEAALASYMGDLAVVDWPVEQTAENAVVLQNSVSVHVPVTALSSSTADHFPNGVDCLGYVMSDGTVGVWVDTSAMYLLDMGGRRITWLVSDETATAALISSDAFPWKYYFGGVVSA